MSGKEKLLDATVLLRCSEDHATCTLLRDALIKVDDVTEAYLTDEEIQGIKYCVGGTIVTTEHGLEKIKRAVRNLKAKNKSLHVSKIATVVGAE